MFLSLFSGRLSLWEGIVLKKRLLFLFLEFQSLCGNTLLGDIQKYPGMWFHSLRQRVSHDLLFHKGLFMGHVYAQCCMRRKKKKKKTPQHMEFQWKSNRKRVGIRGRKWVYRAVRSVQKRHLAKWSGVLSTRTVCERESKCRRCGLFVFWFCFAWITKVEDNTKSCLSIEWQKPF